MLFSLILAASKLYSKSAAKGLNVNQKCSVGWSVWLHRLIPFLLLFSLLPAIVATAAGSSLRKSAPLTIAHRGASAYAPEHTLAAYRLAVDLGADFVEQDLQITRDGVLVCLHDADLARTTNVREVFPDRAVPRDSDQDGTATRGWYVVDFSLAEIKRLDAGAWFNRQNRFAARPEYVGQTIPTLEEAIGAIEGRAGLYIELKDFDFYRSRGFDTAKELAAVLARNGFSKPGRRNSVFVQSFYRKALLRMREIAPEFRRIQLLPMEGTGQFNESGEITREQISEIARYASGIGPSKRMIKSAADVEMLHSAGLMIHPYTFRGSSSPDRRTRLDLVETNGRTFRENCMAEMERFAGWGIDGGFTDYPDLWKQVVHRR